MGIVIKTTLAGVLSVALTAPTFAAPIESLVDEIRRDFIVHMPHDRLHIHPVKSNLQLPEPASFFVRDDLK